MKKYAEQNWFELFLFVLSGVIAVGTLILIVRKDIVAESKGNYFAIFIASAGFACSQLFIIIRKYIAYKKRLDIAISCDYHKGLHGLGILKIYPKRRKTGNTLRCLSSKTVSAQNARYLCAFSYDFH